MNTQILGTPGFQSERLVKTRNVMFTDAGVVNLPSSLTIAGSVSRDPLNTGDVDVLSAGLILGLVTSTQKFAPSILGAVTVAYASGTSLTVAAATAVELVRRVGASGTFKLTGAPTATGVVRTITVTYSAVNVATGVITITAIGVNEVQTLTIGGTTTAGSYRLILIDNLGKEQFTTLIAWNAALGTIQTALDTASGQANGIVVSGTAGGGASQSLVFTFSGSNYAAAPQSLIQVDINDLTGATASNNTRTTAGVAGAFTVDSFVQPTDGSESMRCIIPDGSGIDVMDDAGNNLDVPATGLVVGGFVRSTQIRNYPGATNTTLQAYLKAQLRAAGYAYCFTDDFGM